MNIYQYVPPKNTTRLTGIFIILISLGAGLFAFSVIFPHIPFRWLLQLLSALCFAAIIFLISRYLAKTFVYEIEETDDGSLDLVISELTRRAKITTCRVAVSNVTESYLLDMTKKDDVQKKRALIKSARGKRKIFNYCPDLRSTPVCLLFLNECGEDLLLILSPDERLANYFKKR